jgi:hypothetical protein
MAQPRSIRRPLRGLGERSLSQTVAVISFGVALFLGVAWWNAYSARKLQKQIDALDASEA